MNRLLGKTAIVTGAAHGIGLAIAEAFALEGASVTIADLDVEAGTEAAQRLCERELPVRFVQCDVSSQAAVESMTAQAAEPAGRVDILCNNAAYLGPAHAVLEATEEEWTRCFRVALLGAQYCSQAALPYMLQQGAGAIINIASIQATAACPDSAAYTATKAALLGLTLSLAHDYGPHNIRANAISPGPIQTRISPKPGTPAYEWQTGMTLLRRTGTPQEVATVAAFLASDDASYITGVNLPVDGGWTAK